MAQVWTPAQDDTAIRLARDGHSDKAIGAVIGRAWMAVNKRLRVLRKRGIAIPLRDGNRVPGPRGSYFWTDGRKEELLSLLRAGSTGRAAARTFGVSVGAIRCQVAIMRQDGVNVPSAKRPSRVTQGQHDDALRQLWAEGLSGAEIGRRLGISKNAVTGRVHRLGLPARPSPLVPAKPVKTSSTAAPYRPALSGTDAIPAGHPMTWGMITAGTVLDGSEYPR